MTTGTAYRKSDQIHAVPALESESLSPTTVGCPSFLLSVPFTYSAEIANNVWMEDIPGDQRRVNTQTAMRQFLAIYNFMASRALVHLLPAPANCRLQDLVFTANIGAVLEHTPDRNTVILSNFATQPRVGETAVGEAFFKAMGYRTHVCPHKFEGEAELKHLCGNVYVGGYGIRSEREAYDWMEEPFGMDIIKVRETDPYLYHLDGSIFPLTREKTLVCTEMFTAGEIAELEEHTDIIDVTKRVAMPGICNSVRLGNTLLNASNIHELKRGTEIYQMESEKNRRLEDIAADLGLEVYYFNISEFLKGGAMLSCLVMHLNHSSYSHSLL